MLRDVLLEELRAQLGNGSALQIVDKWSYFSKEQAVALDRMESEREDVAITMSDAAIDVFRQACDFLITQIVNRGKAVHIYDFGAGPKPPSVELAERFYKRELLESLVLIDCSSEMLTRAATSSHAKLPLNRVQGTLADFTDPGSIRKALSGLNGPKIVSILGASYSNYDPIVWKASLQDQMNPGDFILVETECFETTADFEAIKTRYDNKAEFHAMPLRILGLAQEDVILYFDFDEHSNAVLGRANVLNVPQSLQREINLKPGENIIFFRSRKVSASAVARELKAVAGCQRVRIFRAGREATFVGIL